MRKKDINAWTEAASCTGFLFFEMGHFALPRRYQLNNDCPLKIVYKEREDMILHFFTSHSHFSSNIKPMWTNIDSPRKLSESNLSEFQKIDISWFQFWKVFCPISCTVQKVDSLVQAQKCVRPCLFSIYLQAEWKKSNLGFTTFKPIGITQTDASEVFDSSPNTEPTGVTTGEKLLLDLNRYFHNDKSFKFFFVIFVLLQAITLFPFI